MPSASAAARAASGTPASATALGQAWASATPNAGGSAVRRSVTVSGWNPPPAENALTVISGPATSSSTRQAPLREASMASSIARRSPAASSTTESPRWPCLSGGFTTHGGSTVERLLAKGEPAANAAAALRPPRTAPLAELRDGEPQPSRARADAAAEAGRDPGRNRDGPVDPGRDQPLERPPPAQGARSPSRPRPRGSPGGRRSGSPARPDRGRRRSRRQPRSRALRRRPSCAGPAPRTRRRLPSSVLEADSHQARLSDVPGDGALEAGFEGRLAPPAEQLLWPSRSSRCAGRPGPGAPRHAP